MNRPARSLPPRPSPDAGVTLVELLVGLLISGLLVPLIWPVIQGGIRFTEATTWQTQLQRDLDRLTTLLDAEAEDACLFSTTADPAACIPVANPVCNTAQANELRMRVTLLDANNAPAGTRVVRYFRQGTELRRNGPAVLPNGQLNPNTDLDNQLVMRGVTAFTVTPNADCSTANLQITVRSVAASTFAGSTPVTVGPRAIGLRAGSRPFVD